VNTKALQPAPRIEAVDVKRSLWSRLFARLFARFLRPAARHPRPAAPPAAPAGAKALPAPRPAPAPVAAPTRSVPVPIDALTRLLDREPAGRARLRHLALLEASCRSAPADPFARLPPRAADIALRQLDALLPRHPALRVLRLQLERYLQAHRARVAAVLAAEEQRWHPEVVGDTPTVALAPDSMIGGPWGVTDFQETLAQEREARPADDDPVQAPRDQAPLTPCP
jgi:hypothetical protein